VNGLGRHAWDIPRKDFPKAMKVRNQSPVSTFTHTHFEIAIRYWDLGLQFTTNECEVNLLGILPAHLPPNTQDAVFRQRRDRLCFGVIH